MPSSGLLKSLLSRGDVVLKWDVYNWPFSAAIQYFNSASDLFGKLKSADLLKLSLEMRQSSNMQCTAISQLWSTFVEDLLGGIDKPRKSKKTTDVSRPWRKQAGPSGHAFMEATAPAMEPVGISVDLFVAELKQKMCKTLVLCEDLWTRHRCPTTCAALDVRSDRTKDVMSTTDGEM